MNKNQIIVAKIICKIRKTNLPKWAEEDVVTRLMETEKTLKGILNKYGRLSKGSYQYSIKILKYDEDSKTQQKPAYTIASNWKGKLGEVEQFIEEHQKRWIFANDVTDEIEKVMQERINMAIKKE
jgi:hypothetical protein